MARYEEFTIDRGSDVSIQLELTDAGGGKKNLTDHSLKARIKKNYNDSAGENSNAPVRSWTYIPDATVVGNVATGTRGILDIAGLYYQSGGYVADNNDVTYFDNQGKLVGVGGTTAGISTSNWVLTTNAAGVPKWTTTLDGGTY